MRTADAHVALAERFAALYGSIPDGVWAAPGRGNLIGEFTDYNNGSVLPFALQRVTMVAAARRGDNLVRVSSARPDGTTGTVVTAPLGTVTSPTVTSPIVTLPIEGLVPGITPGWAAYVAGVIWAMRQAGLDVGGVSLAIDSDVPIGAGLSSSAALECSVALAVDALYDTRRSRTELAVLAQRAETDYVGVPCGIMDQTASLCCVAGHALLLDTRSSTTRQVPCDPAAAGLALLLIDTRVRHDLGESDYAERRHTCEAAAALLGVAGLCDIPVDEVDDALDRLPDETTRRRARHVITDNARVLASATLLDGGDLGAIGPLLTTAHRSLRDDFEVSCAPVDTAVDASLAAGALGARMIGGGFGGCVLALIEVDARRAVETAVTAAFARADFAPPDVFATVPSAGARRIL
jgi:galactokinase